MDVLVTFSVKSLKEFAVENLSCIFGGFLKYSQEIQEKLLEKFQEKLPEVCSKNFLEDLLRNQGQSNAG